jgi:DUF1680 family protein
MKNRILLLLLLLQFPCWIDGKEKKNKLPVNVVSDLLKPSGTAHLTGYIGKKLDLSFENRILAQDADRLVEPFRNRTELTCWQSEFWGKWFTSAVLAYRYRSEPRLKDVLDRTVSQLIATQSADGYIGNYAVDKHLEKWDIWGRKYCMLGLLAYFDLTKDPKALLAASKVADHLMNELSTKNMLIVKKGSHKGMAASSVLEPVCLLYARTGEKRYLDFAEEIVRQWETPDGPQLISKADTDVASRFPVPTPQEWYGPNQGSKAYEMMSCYEGLLELYRLTGKNIYREAVEKTWQNIHDTEINIAGSGSARECWYGGAKLQTLGIIHPQETCVTATWIKLSQQLLRLTGESKYADAIEISYYNALLGAMKPDGSAWAYYSPLSGYRIVREEQCKMGTNCCNASGPRGLFTFPLTAVMSSKDGVKVNFFANGMYDLETPGKQMLHISQETEYPVNEQVILKIDLPKPEEMTIRIRIPEWSRKTVLKVNGEIVQDLMPGSDAVLQRKWSSQDVISLSLDLRSRLISAGKMPEYLAIMRGPILLARDSRMSDLVQDAWIKLGVNKEGYVDISLTASNQGAYWIQFVLTGRAETYREESDTPRKIVFCDFSSAGNTYDENSRFRSWYPQMLDPTNLIK